MGSKRRVFLNYLRGCLSHVQRVSSQRHQRLVMLMETHHAVCFPDLQLDNASECKIGVGVYQGDIVTFRCKACDLNHMEVRRLQNYDLCHIQPQVPAKLCQAACYIQHCLSGRLPWCESFGSQSYQQKRDSQNLSGTKLQILDCQNIEPYSIESSNKEEASIGGILPQQEKPPRENQKHLPHLQRYQPNSADSSCGLYERCIECVNHNGKEPRQVN